MLLSVGYSFISARTQTLQNTKVGSCMTYAYMYVHICMRIYTYMYACVFACMCAEVYMFERTDSKRLLGRRVGRRRNRVTFSRKLASHSGDDDEGGPDPV